MDLARTVSPTGVLTVLAVVLLIAPVLLGPISLLGPLGAALTVIGLSVLLYWQLSRTDEDDTDGSVWEAIPSRQYDGRHVESGGLSRGEQEAAIEEIQQDAADRDPEQ